MKTQPKDLSAERKAIVDEIATLNLPQNRKLTAGAFLAAACRLAGLTETQVRALRDSMDATPEAFTLSRMFVTRAVREIRSPHWVRPADQARRLSFLGWDVGLEGQTPFGLQAVAALIASEKHPADFGTCADWRARESRLQELQRRQTEIETVLRKQAEEYQREAERLMAAAASSGV